MIKCSTRSFTYTLLLSVIYSIKNVHHQLISFLAVTAFAVRGFYSHDWFFFMEGEFLQRGRHFFNCLNNINTTVSNSSTFIRNNLEKEWRSCWRDFEIDYSSIGWCTGILHGVTQVLCWLLSALIMLSPYLSRLYSKLNTGVDKTGTPADSRVKHPKILSAVIFDNTKIWQCSDTIIHNIQSEGKVDKIGIIMSRK